MAALAEVANRNLAWVESAGGNWAYELRAGADPIGYLKFETESGSRATGELEGRRYQFECFDMANPQIVIVAQGCQVPARFGTQRWQRWRSGEVQRRFPVLLEQQPHLEHHLLFPPRRRESVGLRLGGGAFAKRFPGHRVRGCGPAP